MPVDGTEFVASINDLLDTFRQALLSLIPVADRAGLSWRDLNTHDDWERVAECLHEVFVSSPTVIEPADGRMTKPLPRYDYDYDSYEDYSWIEVAPEDGESPLVLIRLLSRIDPFDTVQVVRVNPHSCAAGRRELRPWAGQQFLLRRRLMDGSSEVIDEVRIPW